MMHGQKNLKSVWIVGSP